MGVAVLFAALGILNGVWAARIPAVKAGLGLSDGSLGVALISAPVGLVLATLAAGRIVDRFGSSRPARVAGALVVVAPVGMGLAGNQAELMAALLVYGAVGGTLDVAMNAQAVRVERGYGRPLMNSFHGLFSFGVLGGALLGGLSAAAGIAPAPTFAADGLALLVTVLVAGRALLPGPEVPDGPEMPPGDGRRPVPAAGGPASRGPAGGGSLRRWFGGVTARVAILGALSFCSLLGEGAVENWSAVYFRYSLGVTAGLAAAGLAAFSITMACGRLFGDRLAARIGPVRLMRGCGFLAAAGLGAGLLSRSPAGAVAGFALFGAGLSCTFPQLVSAAGNADPSRPGSMIARVAGSGYAGGMTGPVVIGAAAGLTSLPLALGIPVLLAGIIGVSARAVSPIGRPGGA
ncbi:MAG TPA: MFS transporter [Streptosporangiaceae bacterium]